MKEAQSGHFGSEDNAAMKKRQSINECQSIGIDVSNA
jgi:hypothetical protein